MILSSVGFVMTAGLVRAADEIPKGGTLKVGWAQEMDTLNPFVTNTVQGRTMLKLLYDSLLAYNKTLVPAAQLAKSWTTSTDKLTWTYTMVENAKFTDGTALKASDVKFTLDLIKNQDLSAFRDQVKYISNVTTSGDYQVIVTYSSAIATVLSDMCLVPILPQHLWKDMNKTQILQSKNDDPIGSSAWTLESWEKGTSVILDANPDYWDGAPHLDSVIFVTYANSEAMVNALKSGEIDCIMKELPPTSLATLNQDSNIKVATEVDLYYREISINSGLNTNGNPTLRDVHVRQALAMATDKQELVNIVQLGYAEPGTSIIQKAASAWWDPTLEPFPFNISMANALLNESGYMDVDTDGIREAPGNASLEMSYTLLVLSRWPEEMRTGQQLQTWWAKIGVHLTVTSADANTINSYVYPDYTQDMFLWGYSGQPDPSFSLLIMLSNQVGDWNDCGYANATYDDLYDQQAHATDPAVRQTIINQMQEIIYRDSPYIVLYYMTAKGAYRIDKFTGFVNMPTGLLSAVNFYTLREVHLIKSEGGEAARTDYLPWAVAGLAIVVAVGAIGYALMRGKKGGAGSTVEETPEKGETAPKPPKGS
jgi:peptide/nickel transport system substrate-binding protein